MTPGPTDARDLGSRIRRRVLETAYAAGKGHLGSALSICEIVAVIALEARGFGSRDKNRDRVILSKGHASLALYCALVEIGAINEEQLKSYSRNGSLLQTHPDFSLIGIDFSTGSLGMGLGYGVGTALAARINGGHERTFVILSDSELNEGSTWESAALAGTLGLGKLTIVLDMNGQQALGFTDDVLRVGDPAVTWCELGFDVHTVNGHDTTALRTLVMKKSNLSDRPRLIVAKTDSGHGVSFMERQIEWHYRPMNTDQFAQALSEIQ